MTPNPRPWSLIGRLNARVLVLVICGWMASVTLAILVLDHEMSEMFDTELQVLVETTLLSQDAAGGNPIPRLVGVAAGDGERVLRVLSADRVSADAPWPALGSDGFHDPPGWRVLRHSADGVVIEAAHATGYRRKETVEAAAGLLVLLVPLVALLLWGLRRAVRRVTAPVTALATHVAGRSPDDLSPLDATGLPDELRPLAEALDGYLTRIASLRQSERDFIANAAHELRTPLAGLRNRLELSADPDARAALRSVDALARRVERLLQLSRLDSGLGLGRGPADLVRILRLLIDEWRPRGGHPIRFDDSDLNRLMVAADPDALAILLRNLIENALEHGTGAVQIRLAPDGRFSIENPAPPGPLPRTRFTRGLGSAGTGLGLSIIEALARAMDLPLQRAEGNGSVRFETRFPLCDQDGRADPVTAPEAGPPPHP